MSIFFQVSRADFTRYFAENSKPPPAQLRGGPPTHMEGRGSAGGPLALSRAALGYRGEEGSSLTIRQCKFLNLLHYL